MTDWSDRVRNLFMQFMKDKEFEIVFEDTGKDTYQGIRLESKKHNFWIGLESELGRSEVTLITVKNAGESVTAYEWDVVMEYLTGKTFPLPGEDGYDPLASSANIFIFILTSSLSCMITDCFGKLLMILIAQKESSIRECARF
jgi:hypothetical protein